MTILTGFEPFAGRRKNRSWAAVRKVSPRPDLQTVQLPVDFTALRTIVPELVATRPNVLLLVGEGDAPHVCVEAIGTNVAHADIPDNAGHRPRHVRVRDGRPLAYETTWITSEVVAAIQGAGVHAEISHHAGTYACNAALYLALDAAADLAAPIIIGFLHVPARSALFGASTRRLSRALEATLSLMQTTAGRRAASIDLKARGTTI